MLRGIPDIISPELLNILAEMGHGDSIVVADTFFPARSKSENGKVIYSKGVGAAQLIDSILKILPLDSEMGENPVQYMIAEDTNKIEKVHEEVLESIVKNGYDKNVYHPIGRYEFYEAAKNAYAVVSTGEDRPYGCFILYKGIK